MNKYKMTAETPTPLTDALIEQLNIEPWLSLSTKCAELEAHARQLERRCAELEEQLKKEKSLRSHFQEESRVRLEDARGWKRLAGDTRDRLNELKHERDQLDDERLSWKHEAEKRGEAIAELRRDRERLDWLLAQDPPCNVILDYAFDPAWDTMITLDSRAALDKAMRDSRTGNASDEASPPVAG